MNGSEKAQPPALTVMADQEAPSSFSLRPDPPDPDRYHLVREGTVIARIFRLHDGPNEGRWDWLIRIQHQVPGQPSHGIDETLEQAKAAVLAALVETPLELEQGRDFLLSEAGDRPITLTEEGYGRLREGHVLGQDVVMRVDGAELFRFPAHGKSEPR